MIIKVLGIGSPNRGAELMLQAIKQRYECPEVGTKVVEVTWTDKWLRIRAGIKRRVPVPLPRTIDGALLLLPLSLRKHLGLLTDSDVEVIMDASGYAYGDKWGVSKLYQRLGEGIGVWKEQGKKVILLPQALGPFEDERFQKVVSHVVDHADLVFPRDRESYEHLVAITGERDNVIQRPDFTNLVAVSKTAPSLGEVVVIPNSKMVEMDAAQSVEEYVETMAAAIRLSQAAGKRVFLLNHEGAKDRQIIEAINGALDVPVDVFESDDPIAIKEVIATTEVVVSSRFHGLVSALSQGVPVVAMGWSHKYKELLEEYSVGEYLVPVDEVKVQNVLRTLLQDNAHAEVARQIAARAEALKQSTREMWSLVDETVRFSE